MMDNGRVVVEAEQDFTYDREAGVADYTYDRGAGLAGYTYDALGRMLTRTDSAGTTTFVWAGMDCIRETDHAGVVTNYYIPRNGQAQGMGAIRSFDRSGVTYQCHADANGSIRKITDNSGTVVATYDYSAFGEQLASTSDSVPNGGFQYRYIGSAGIRWDMTTGLYYMRARWYDPSLGCFVSRDPIDAVNRYMYSMDSPMDYIDPYGLCVIQVRYNPIKGYGWFYHAYIVASEPNGIETFYRGGPTNNAGPVSPPIGGGGKPSDWGPIRADWGIYGPRTVDWNDDATQIRDTIINVPGDCSCYLKCFIKMGETINKWKVDYYPVGPNSNSTVTTLLKSANIPVPKPSVGTTRVPGWNTPIVPTVY